jgi:flagellar basal-body rod modification protein FlgD
MTAVTGTGSTTGTTDTVALGRNQLAQNFDTFLTLLTTQMKNQDPLSPMDSTQFTQQLVQMTGVEQQLAANDLLKQLVTNSVSSAVNLIGKQVEATNDTAKLSNGQAQWQYSLDPGATDTTLEVVDANGNTVASYAASDNSAGDHSFSWNGHTATGRQAPDGVYTLRVTAKDPSSKPVNATPFVQGLVSGVEQSNGTTMLTINGVKVPLNAITTVLAPPATTDTSNSNNPAGQTPAAAA